MKCSCGKPADSIFMEGSCCKCADIEYYRWYEQNKNLPPFKNLNIPLPLDDNGNIMDGESSQL
jgi:hypothetical protein